MAFKHLIVFIIAISSVISELLDKEDQITVSYTKCHYDADCMQNSFCFGNDDNKVGFCKCKDGFYLFGRNKTNYECRQPANYGEPCERDIHCQIKLGVLAKCDSTCKCPTGTHFYKDDPGCYKSVLLYDNCRSRAECQLADGSYGFCTDGICDCDINQKATNDRQHCKMSKNLGETCASTQECSDIPNTICQDTCKCKPGYFLSRDEKSCLEAATKFGDGCEYVEQCTRNLRGGAVCTNGNCTCTENHHNYGTTCYMSKRNGERCVEEEECIYLPIMKDKVNCNDGVCQCIYGEDNMNDFGCYSRSNTFQITVGLVMLSIVLKYCLDIS